MPTQPAAQTLADYQHQYRDLLAQLSELGFITAGSLAPRYNRCGKPTCHCHADPERRHGPYWQWTAKLNGKTVNRRLTNDQAALYQQWIDNDRRLRAIINDLRAVAAHATELIMTEAAETTPEV